MNALTFRQIASKLGVSVATVSRVIHRDPRVRPETAERILAFLEEQNYHLDPVVSMGLSRIRTRSFYRETIAWCGDCPHEEMPWLKDLFASLESCGARLGYKIEYFHFQGTDSHHLEHLASIWKARGIRGVLLAPFTKFYHTLAFPWEHFAWITIGPALEYPTLHHVGRDYEADILVELDWLKSKGCRRPCFVQDPEVNYIYKRHMLQAALMHYNTARPRPSRPYYELDIRNPEHFADWVRVNRPDGIILPGVLAPQLQSFTQSIASLPTVLLSPLRNSVAERSQISFTAQYEVLGQVAVHMLHRLLGNREFGIPRYKQSALLSSGYCDSSPLR